MKEITITIRNRVTRFFYKRAVRPLYFRIDEEVTHQRAVALGRILGSNTVTRALTRMAFSYSHPNLTQTIKGITFPNPVGLAAGFDKDAYLTRILPSIGFGFEEIGSVTGEPCEGNPGKRLWRLIKSKGIVVYYGLKNEGAERISERLKGKKFLIPIGINIAKTNTKKTVDLEAGVEDYVKAYKAFSDIGDYYTINISCPNTFGGEPFSDAHKLEKLLSRIFELPKTKPIFIKLSPDLSHQEIDDIIFISKRYGVDGFICTNLSKKRDNKNMLLDSNIPDAGGISGKPAEEASNRIVRYVYGKTKGEFIIIGCGGVFTAEDAYKKIKLGASLVQLITGMIFEGPQIISEINQGLIYLIKKDGFQNISEAVGKDNAS